MTGFFPHQPPEPPEPEKSGPGRLIGMLVLGFVAGVSLTAILFVVFDEDPTYIAQPVATTSPPPVAAPSLDPTTTSPSTTTTEPPTTTLRTTTTRRTTTTIQTTTTQPTTTTSRQTTTTEAKGWNWCRWYPDTIAVCPVAWEEVPHDGYSSFIRDYPPTGWKYILLTVSAEVNEDSASFGTFSKFSVNVRTTDGFPLDDQIHDWGGDCSWIQQVTTLSPAVCNVLYLVPENDDAVVMIYEFGYNQFSEWLLPLTNDGEAT